jgi:hypothetical protein
VQHAAGCALTQRFIHARRGVDRTQAVQFLLSRLKSGAYVAFREPGAVPTEEAPIAARGAAAAPEDDEAAAAELLHTEEQARVLHARLHLLASLCDTLGALTRRMTSQQEHDLAIHINQFKAVRERSPLCACVALALTSASAPAGAQRALGGQRP